VRGAKHYLSSSFDVIVSNPPYIAPNDVHLTQGDLRYEPLSALVAEDDGFQDILQIASEARAYLKPGGYVMLEHGFEQGAEVARIFKKNGLY